MSVSKSRKTLLYVIVIGVLIATNVITFIYFWNQVNALTAERNSLKHQVNDLNSQINLLNSQINTLQNQVDSLSTERDSLMQENEDLNAQIAMLQNQVNDLQDQLNSFQSQVSYLQNKVDNYKKIINLEVSVTLADDEVIAIPGNSYYVLSYNTEYAGYLIISFTATSGISIYVGSDFTGEYYYTYPSEGTATDGTFYVPVFPGTTYIFIDNRGLFTPGVTVTITITYVY